MAHDSIRKKPEKAVFGIHQIGRDPKAKDKSSDGGARKPAIRP
jgi:hypothetical protein